MSRAWTMVAVAGMMLAVPGPPVSAQETTESRTRTKVGAPVELQLAANPTTGYLWRIDPAASTLASLEVEDRGVSRPPEQRDRPLVGAGGTHTWRITPRRPGESRLVVTYGRSFEPAPIRRHIFLIDAVTAD